MTAVHERTGALEAIDRILNRGGDADDVLRQVLNVLSSLYAYVAVAFVEEGRLVPGPSSGELAPGEEPHAVPIEYQGAKVAELHVSEPGPDDAEFLARIATLVSAHALVAWDTGGETWEP